MEITLFGKRVLSRGQGGMRGVGSGKGRGVGDGAAWTWQDNLRTAFVRIVEAEETSNCDLGAMEPWAVLCNILSWTLQRGVFLFQEQTSFALEALKHLPLSGGSGGIVEGNTQRSRVAFQELSCRDHTTEGQGWDALHFMGWTLHGQLEARRITQLFWKGMHSDRQLSSIVLCLSGFPGY